MGKITSYKDFKNNVQSIRDELTKQGYTPRSVPSEQKEETKNTKKIEKGKGLFKETGKSSFNDIPKIQELQNEYQKAKDWGFYDYTIDQIKKEELPTKFGNVNMNKRPLIRWNDELKKKYENELKSWGYDPEIGGIDTVFGGSDKFGTDINNSGWNVAYTPIMPDGTFLDKGTVDNYMNSLVKEAYEKNGNVTNEELETLDKKGMQVGDKYVHGIFAGVDGDEKDYHKPYSAEDRGKLMHFSGKYGAINIAKRGTDNLKTNPNEEQSDSDEKEEYLNQQVDIPITDNKSISLKYRTVKTIDNFLKRNKEKNKYKKAQQLDEMIDKLDLSENELKNAKSYAGLKKLSLMSSSNGKDSVLKELGQFVAYPIGEMYDFAKRAERTYVKDGFPFKVQQMGAGDYSEQLQELDKYYSENPDELGNDFFNRKSTGNDAYSDYMDNLRKVKAYEAFDNTNPVTHFIAEKGFGSMGQMLAAYGTAGLMGLPDVTEGVSSAAKKVAGGTKIGQVVSKVANATPDIANVAEKGIGSKIANAAINKANTLSIGSAAKFLNPLDNSTTLLMGIDSAQQKYDDLVKNGYDKDTAYKNAMFTGYVNTITEKMGYDGTPESMMFALSPTGSTKKNVGKVLKQYMKANVGEGLEEVYATLFERMGDVVSKVGYVDENGKIQQRKLVGKEGVIDLPALGESFLGGAVGGAVMGGAGVVDTILHTDAKSVRECGDKVRQALSKANKEVSQKVHEAGVEMPELPKQIDWKKSTVPEMKEYFNKVVKVYRDILSDEKVINYDRKVAENTLNKMNTAETGNEVNEATNINNVNATPQTENSIQNVPKTSEIEPLQAVQETAPLNAQVNDISNINTQNSKINADNSTINDTTSEINSVDTLNAIDTLPNISTQENGVQSSVNRVTEEVHNAMNKVGLNVSESATGIQEANTKFMSNNDNLFDRNYVSNYANDFVQAMSEKNGRSYTVLSQETDNLADELVNKTLTGNSVLDGNREFQTVVRNFKDVLREGIKKNANLHNNVYGANEVLNAQVQDIENGDYSSLNITENPNNNVTFAPITENEQNIGYVIERDNGYSNELSESDFTVKQKNGEYGTRNGITYGHFGTHQNSNGNNIVSYLPTGNAVAILPNQNSAIEFMKQAENKTSGYSIYLYDDNGVTKTGGDMLQFINVLNNAKNAVQVEQNSGNVGIQSNTGVSNNVESEKINSQAPNTDENTNTTQTDNAIKSIEISEEDKIPGLLQDEYSDLLSLEDRTALDTLGSAIGVPIKIVPTISNDANGCYYKGVIYISLSADDKVMTVFSHELTHYLEDTLDYTEYKKCVLGFIQKNTDKSIDELVKEKVDTYAKSSINLTYEEATREIVADYTQNILKDADAVMEFVDSIENKEQKRGVIRRLLDAIKELINKIKAKFSSKHSQMQDLQKTHDLLENMLKEAAENTESDTGSETRYSFGGTKAETANITQLSRAKEMELNGEKAETIRPKTGWSRGLDNKWKFEIDDSKAKYKEEKIRLGKAVNLNEVLEHEDLFKAYPDLKKVKVKEISNLDARGIYSPNFDCIFINENLPTQEKLKSLIHEVQHAIQVREGFAVGESPDSKNRNQSAGEIEADDVKARQSMSKEERLNTFPESMKPNQNADVVFWESGKGVDNSNNNADIKYSMKKSNDEKIENRLSGDDLLNAYDTIEEIRNVGGRVDENGYAYVYHNTSKDNAENIRKTGVMSAKEDGIFVSTKLDGQSAGYGNETVSLKIPVEKLVLDDMFDDELHFRIPLKNKNDTLNVSNYLIDKSNADNAQIKSIAKNTLNKDNVEYAYRYSDMNNEQKEAYNRAKKGDVKSAYNLIEQFVYQSGIMKNLSNNVYLLPVIGAEGTSDNILPECIAYFISKKNGNQVFYEIVKQKESNSRKLSIWERMKENYPEFDISSDIRYNDIKGKSFLLIDDNSTTGRTFKGLEGFIEDNGGKVVGYYAMTTGQDMSEKMITTDETWEKLKQLGIEKIRNFAESEGIRREISRNGLTERETRELIRQYRKKVDKRRTDSFKPKSEGTRTEIRRVYENGRRNSENGRTRGKFSLKSSNSSNLDTVENNTDNVQIKSDNFKNWFGDWENNPSKASKVVNEDGTPKIVYHGTTSNFTTFDTQRFNTRENSGDYVGEGFFFTDKESTAKKYGSSVMPVYLNLRNPLIINTENDGKKFRSTFLNMYQKGDKELRDLIGGDYDYFSIMKENPSAIRQELQRRGYDGLIDNLYGQYAVFNSEQIKSATDNIGTFDKNNADIRYSIKKNETDTDKNLVAIHNLSEKKLKENLALGGFPAPSIAVTKADIGHNGYGDISVIFGRDTIDPTKSSDNRLYSADAYTSTFPQVDYKLNEDALNRLSEHLNMSVSQLESNIFDTGDKERIISKMKASEQVREAFVKDNNFKVEPVLRDPKPSKFGTNTNEAFYLLAKHVTYEQLVNNADVRNDYFEAVEEGSKLKGATKRFIEKMNKQLDAAKNKPEIFEREQARFNDDMKILNGQGEKVEDAYSHSDGVNNVIKENQSEFNNYAKNLVDKVLEDKYIRKDIDPFDEYGNGRDFSEMHTEYTLENIVRAMSKGKNQENGIFGAGIGEMRSAVSQEYKTVEDMKKDSGRIQKLSDEEIDNIYSKSEKLLGDITSDLAQLIDTGNNFTDIDVASENVKNALLKGTNKRSIKRYLAEYINGVSDTTIDKIVELADNLKNIPVKYFEAKPHRAIGFDEVKAVILPDNVDPNLNQKLKDMGINTVKYKSGDEADRQRALESVDSNVRFSHTVGNKAEGKASTVHSVSKKLISDYGVESKVKPSDISEAIADITSKINDTYYGESDINRKYAKLEKAAYGVAEKIVDQMKKKDDYAEEIYNNLRKEIKSTKIRISEVDKGDFTEWNDFRKQNFGYLTISNKEGIPVDSYYKELAQEYSGIFDESTHMAVGDQLRNIVDTLRNLKPKEYDLSTEERDEMLEEVTNEVILRSINLADDMGYIDKNGNADKIYTESDMRGALDKQKERLNNKHEKQLDRQKERLENKYEKRLETQKTKYIEQREKIRKQLIDKVNQQKEKAKARKKESEDRTKLLKLAREINSMKLSPQDKNKLPDILKEIDTVSKGILKKGYTTKDGKAVMGELDLKQLKEDYELLKQDENFLPDKDVELKISRLDKMQIADMNINDVRDLIQTLQEVKHEIRTKDKMINDVRNREIAHTAMESIKEIQRGKGIENKQKGKWYRGYISTQLTPERMFRRLSGYAKNGVFEGLAKDLSDGQRKSMTFKQRASEKFKTVINKTEEMSKFTGKKAELIDISKYDTQGRKVYITPDMRTSLYLHSKNYSNLKHIQYGGITIPNMDLYKQGKIKDAYESAGVIIRLTPSQVNEITSKMTPFEKQFADVAYNFFNDDCSKAINETSIALKGYEIATARDYFPIVSNRNFINNDFESLVKNGTLEGKGMLKERKYASNPVALESVIRAINRQMSDVADYYGLAIPIRNFNKVYNSMGRNYNYSVKESLKQKWGLNADKYIENLITDLQSGRKTDGTLFDMLKGHYAQGVLSLNLGVTLKQAASYPTAAAVVGYKPLAKAFSERVSDSDRKIIDKYTPLLWYRSQGYTTSEFGDYADGTYEDWTKKGKMPLLMGWIQAMDIATTTKLWKAAEFYVRDNYETLEQGTDEYYKQVADVYNSIIENTQPNYSTMQRPDILRNPNALVKSVTMFKTQVMQNFNILYDAYGEYNARYQDYQSNKTEENAEDLKSAAHNLGKAISSQIIAAIVLNLCDGIGRFLKGKFDDYYGEDDKDKTITLKSAMSAYLTDCFNTVMGTTLGGSETAALVEYILSIFNIGKGAVWYDIQAPALDTINNTVDSLTSLLTTVSKNGASSPWAYVKSINKLLKELGTATGIPLKNGEALLYGIYKNITDWTKKENVFETLDSWTDESKREYTKDDGHKYRANMSIKEYKEYNAYYEKIVKDMQSGKIRKKNGEKYSSNGIKQAARKKANEKFEKLFTEKVE